MRKIGDFPSKSALADADLQLTNALARWEAFGQAAAPAEVSAIYRRRAYVRLRGGDEAAALVDLGAGLRICEAQASDIDVRYMEMPKVLVLLAEVKGMGGRWKEALASYERAADLLGEPLEDTELLSGRAKAKQRLGMMAGAAADYQAAADVYRRIGARGEAEIQAERAGVALLGAGEATLGQAEDGLCGVIQRSIGLLSEDVALLQRVVIADTDARVGMAALAWHRGLEEVAETYWKDACDRLDTLVEDSKGKQMAIGLNGDAYRCSRYADDQDWLRTVRDWPEDAITWLNSFLRNRRGVQPRASYFQDLAVGRRPGAGSTLMDYMIATDAFRRSSDDRGP